LYGFGFGSVTPPVPAGQLFAGAPPANGKVTVTIGGLSTPVSFAGLTSPGLFQINITIPSNAPSGDQPIQAAVDGSSSPVGTLISIQ
jgi:uncharacterized protein (TIGR03437 family)